MAKNKVYCAMGEEATRGTGEVTTVGFIPLMAPSIPASEFDDVKRGEFRGSDSIKGENTVRRLSQKWGASLEIPFFTEAGTTAGMMGTLLKHFFGYVSSAQNGATSQYYHMMSPTDDPFLAANLGTKALTVSYNINEGAVMKNWPFLGGRVSSIGFEQEAGQPLKVTAEMMGQKRDTTTAELGSETFAAENLRADFNNLTVYTGTITRTGTGPDFTDITFGSATQLKPDKVSIKFENGMEDMLRLDGNDYADKTRMGIYTVTIEMTIDWEDPAAGFSSADDFNLWMASSSTTNFAFHWDTGTQAGTGDNHGLIIDVPTAQRQGGQPEYDLEKDPMITLTFEGLYNSTTGYIGGLMLKNTATVV